MSSRVGAKAFESRDYDKAKEALGRSGTIAAFRDRVAAGNLDAVRLKSSFRGISCFAGGLGVGRTRE